MRRLIVLRPEPGASETVARARELGLEAVAIPLFQVEPVDWDLPEASGFDGLLLTSANAVRHAGDRLLELRGLKTYCVGESTADAARKAGFDIAATGKSGVDRLLGSIEHELKLLHVAGEHRTAIRAEQDIHAITVYRSGDRDPGEAVAQAQGNVVAVHSRRAGEAFARLADKQGLDRSTISVAAISRHAADGLGSGWQSVESAEGANDGSLLVLAKALCNKSAR